MNYKEVISRAWEMVGEEGLLRYGIIPAIFTTLVGVGYAAWQVILFRESEFFGNSHAEADVLLEFAKNFWSDYPIVLIVLAGIVLFVVLAWLLVPPFCEGGLIGLIAAKRSEKEIQSGDGMKIGAHFFWKMFELQALLATFGIVEFILIFSLGIRNLGVQTWLLMILGVIFFFGFLFSFLFIYARNFIVLEKMELVESLAASAKLVISSMKQTFLMWLIVLLISLRVLVNIVLIFLIPALVVFVVNFFVAKAALTIGIIFGTITGLLVFLLAVYLAGTLHVFTTAVWTLTFLGLEHDRAEKILE